MGPREEDRAFMLACEWPVVEDFMGDPQAWVARLETEIGRDKARVIALPPKRRAATFVCRYASTTATQRKQQSVVVEGTQFSDLMVVRVVPDWSRESYSTLWADITSKEKLELYLWPDENTGFAHLSLPQGQAAKFAEEVLRSPLDLPKIMNGLIEGDKAKAFVQKGIAWTEVNAKKAVRIAEPSPQGLKYLAPKASDAIPSALDNVNVKASVDGSGNAEDTKADGGGPGDEAPLGGSLEDGVFVYQADCPSTEFSCYKSGGTLTLAPKAAGYTYVLTAATSMVVCYYPT